jgi:hypothetical protein
MVGCSGQKFLISKKTHGKTDRDLCVIGIGKNSWSSRGEAAGPSQADEELTEEQGNVLTDFCATLANC